VTAPFTIATDGDELERETWPQWTQRRFPSYETFWTARIVPLTYRVHNRVNIRFPTTAELSAAGYTDEDVTVAQLHYTILRHLHRVFVLLDNANASFLSQREHRGNRAFGPDEFFESFARLSGVSDLADELLARRASPGMYGAWNERDGGNARREWRRQAASDPLRPVRDYRNRLVHGRIVPETFVAARHPDGRDMGVLLFYPTLDTVDRYLDWRVAFEASASRSPDFDEAALIARDAWDLTVDYVEHAWVTHLLPNV
jgi:hypothetical protein